MIHKWIRDTFQDITILSSLKTTDSEIIPFFVIHALEFVVFDFSLLVPRGYCRCKITGETPFSSGSQKSSTDLHSDSSETSSFYRSCVSAHVFAALQWGPLQTDRVVYYEGSDFMDYAPHSLAGLDKRLQQGTGRRLTGLEDSHSTTLHGGNGCSIFVKVFMVSRL